MFLVELGWHNCNLSFSFLDVSLDSFIIANLYCYCIYIYILSSHQLK